MASSLLRSKRSLDFDPLADLCMLPDSLPCKRPCPPPMPLAFIDELCEFDACLDLEPSTSEELVLEMMKSLENVIGAIEESPSQRPNCPLDNLVAAQQTVAQDSTMPFSDLEHLSSPSDCAKTHQIKLLLEASDDELGIPADSGNVIDHQTPTNDADWGFVDGHSPDSVNAPSAVGLNSTEGLYSQMLEGGWIDGSFDQFDDSMAVYMPRDSLDLISSDNYL